ncbi:MAG: isoaspartyl peptidase/L-asparaginase family protein [candidate division WOR-3 bacterium]|nr:isoaspartyl peptidase/L-asparaginase family protein [candidate division WOR-3 bacterium]
MPVLIIHGGAGRKLNVQAHRQGIYTVLQKGWQKLTKNTSALDVVCEVVQLMEDDPTFNCGTGSTLTIEGKIEMDAGVMTDKGNFGAVAAISQVRNPILVARKVMEETDHLLLVGAGAQKFARRCGFKKYQKITAIQRKRLHELKTTGKSLYFRKIKKYLNLGTVGAIALDRNKNIAVATSTGGILGKLPGRIGDSAIIGAGLYANKTGAATATGHGEGIMRLLLSKMVVDLMAKYSAQKAVDRAMEYAKTKGVLCGVIALNKKGDIGYGNTTPMMSWAYIKDGKIKMF